MRSRPLYDTLSLLARLGVGIVFIAHGWQKIQVGITATSKSFEDLNVPAPTASAIYATFAELLGGLALIVGLALPVVGVLLFLDMAGAFIFVHAGNGLFLVDQGKVTNGWELVLLLGLASLLFAAGAGGRFTLDNRLFPRRTTTPDDSARPQPEHPEPSASAGPWPNDPAQTSPPADVPASPQATTKPTPARRRPKWPSRPRTSQPTSPATPDTSTTSTDSDAEVAPGRRPWWPLRSRRRAAPEPADSVPAPADEPQPRSTSGPPADTGSAKPATVSDGSPQPPPSGVEPAGDPEPKPAGPSASKPRLAADIIGDTAADVRVAGQRKRNSRPEKKP